MQLAGACALFHVSLLIWSMWCRLAAVKKAADAAGRRLCFVGMSLNTYLEAAHKEGMAPFDPKELIPVGELDNHDPNKVMVITTGSQVTLPPLLASLLHVIKLQTEYGLPLTLRSLFLCSIGHSMALIRSWSSPQGHR